MRRNDAGGRGVTLFRKACQSNDVSLTGELVRSYCSAP
jgi:hypothetical protein